MTWTKLDDGFIDHPKVANLSPAAIGLHVCGLVYCGKHLTDGAIPKGVERRLTSTPNVKRWLDELLDVGLWLDEGTEWAIHDYLDFQPSAAHVNAEREAARERMRKARERRRKEREEGENL